MQHREVQGNESDLFMSYFPQGLKYREGGVESAFHKTTSGTTPAAIRKLYQVKEEEHPCDREGSELGQLQHWGLLHPGPGSEHLLCLVWWQVQHPGAQQGERPGPGHPGQRAAGKAQVEIITDGEEPAEMIQVLGPKPALKEGNPEEDITADQTNAQAAALYKVSDATGQMNLTKVADSSPFASELLIPDDCFVLDNGLCGKIYIWKGRKANEKERQAALQVADGFISRMRYSPNTQVEILPQAERVPSQAVFKD